MRSTVRLALAFAVFAAMLVEAARAARNERRQLSRGGREPSGDVYPLMRLAYPAAFIVMLLEQRAGPPPRVFAAGAALFAIGKTLKWWAILTLGPAWTFRVIVVPGDARVAVGPYRFLRHPNYAGVVGELVGVALMTGARVTGPIVLVLFGLLLKKRIIVEERALSAGGPVIDHHV
jgi:methyltransferase